MMQRVSPACSIKASRVVGIMPGGTYMLNRVVRSVAIGAVAILASVSVARAQTNFAEDVNSALDHFLDYARSHLDANNVSDNPIALVGLTIMEKHDLTVSGSPI